MTDQEIKYIADSMAKLSYKQFIELISIAMHMRAKQSHAMQDDALTFMGESYLLISLNVYKQANRAAINSYTTSYGDRYELSSFMSRLEHAVDKHDAYSELVNYREAMLEQDPMLLFHRVLATMPMEQGLNFATSLSKYIKLQAKENEQR